MNWKACFSLEEGKTYRIRYVAQYSDRIREGTFTYNGQIMRENIAILVTQEDDAPGLINIIQIDEQVAVGDIR